MTVEAAVPSPGHTLVLYDGVCGLCNRLVAFLLRHDKRDGFRFASLQSELGQTLLRSHGLNTADLDSVVVIKDLYAPNEQVFTRSAAILTCLNGLGGAWRAAAAAKIVPLGIREASYKLIARHRYQIFGKHEVCPMPKPQDRVKFLA